MYELLYVCTHTCMQREGACAMLSTEMTALILILYMYLYVYMCIHSYYSYTHTHTHTYTYTYTYTYSYQYTHTCTYPCLCTCTGVGPVSPSLSSLLRLGVDLEQLEEVISVVYNLHDESPYMYLVSGALRPTLRIAFATHLMYFQERQTAAEMRDVQVIYIHIYIYIYIHIYVYIYVYTHIHENIRLSG